MINIEPSDIIPDGRQPEVYLISQTGGTLWYLLIPASDRIMYFAVLISLIVFHIPSKTFGSGFC